MSYKIIIKLFDGKEKIVAEYDSVEQMVVARGYVYSYGWYDVKTFSENLDDVVERHLAVDQDCPTNYMYQRVSCIGEPFTSRPFVVFDPADRPVAKCVIYRAIRVAQEERAEVRRKRRYRHGGGSRCYGQYRHPKTQNERRQVANSLEQGVSYKRDSQDYQDLLDRAFLAMFSQNNKAQKALLATLNATLTHSIGRSKINETVLTKKNFVHV